MDEPVNSHLVNAKRRLEEQNFGSAIKEILAYLVEREPKEERAAHERATRPAPPVEFKRNTPKY
jgi:hypothetical protein